MIRKLRSFAARSVLLVVMVVGLGFGLIAAAMGAVIGGLLLVGVRLAQVQDAPVMPNTPDQAAAAAGAAGDQGAISA
ncbi:hypothetical protein EYE42_00575 [Paracoccus subflavus]|uniref:Uncharacterized protein n=1 Tax=Paracoccus subflavus TaxID=2528244 RepID=A0A4V2JCR5_9RHOB|nr:hypothetical protein [Paracoccus subflavus]TBN43671.1 hypothetical protein EYE42_00575 [Paracoccus subflavus]